jgi:hypothetical protein
MISQATRELCDRLYDTVAESVRPERAGMSVSQIAAELAVHPYTIVRWIRDGVKPVRRGPRVFLTASKPGGSWRIERADLERFIDACTDLSVTRRPQQREIQPPPAARRRGHRRAVAALKAMGVMA